MSLTRVKVDGYPDLLESDNPVPCFKCDEEIDMDDDSYLTYKLSYNHALDYDKADTIIYICAECA